MKDTSPAPDVARVRQSHRLRTLWSEGIRCPSDALFAFGVALIWVVFYNVRFWEQTAAAMWAPTFGSGRFIVSLFVLVLVVNACLLLLMPTRLLMRIAASVLFIIAAMSSHFIGTYGAVMNKDMMRNVLQTDGGEVGALLTVGLIAHLLLLGVVPALLVWKVVLPPRAWGAQLRQRTAFAALGLAVALAGVFANSADYAVFLREHKPVRFALTPVATVSSLTGLITASHAGVRGPLVNLAGKVMRLDEPNARPLVVFLVIGETARAANFQLGGYARATNPQLSRLDDLIYFTDAASCGTSTAISVPCMFSPRARAQFDVDSAGDETNLIDTLAAAGLAVEWRDNNAGCKGVCARIGEMNYADKPRAGPCAQAHCFDEVMLEDAAQALRGIERDTVIVFHQNGSHGPAYFERYPPQFELFKPACRSNELHRCTQQEVLNTYDNTIAYTDYVLSRQIELLRASTDVDSLLIYASDHGESLGEQGVYLHGLPYRFAPDVQKRVPMLLWASSGYMKRAHLDAGCLQAHAAAPVSHDHLYHTVLGATDVRDQAYDAALDLLSSCRTARYTSN